MLDLEEQIYLAGKSRYEGKSLRAIEKESGRNFRTVKKYVDCEDWNEGKKRLEGLDPLKETINEWLLEDQKRNRKYRRTGTKIYNDLLNDK